MDGHSLCICYGSLDVLEGIIGLAVADDITTKVQRRATELVKGLNNCSYKVRLVKLGLTTLEERRRWGELNIKHIQLRSSQATKRFECRISSTSVSPWRYDPRGQCYKQATKRSCLEVTGETELLKPTRRGSLKSACKPHR